MEGLGSITAAAIAFVGTHLLLSHPLRQPIVGAVGNAAFLGIYSAVAAARGCQEISRTDQFVVPAKAGTQGKRWKFLGSRLRGNDEGASRNVPL